MVDFRYHVVSIVAVFLALATGILFGTTALNGTILDDLRGDVRALRTEKDELRDFRDDLEKSLQRDDQVLRGIAPRLVADTLSGHRVVLVSAPQVAKEVRESMAAMLRSSGATVSGTVRLQPKLSDPRSTAEIDDLVARLVPAGVDLTGASSPAERFAAVLASVLASETATSTASPSGGVQALTGFEDAGLVDVEGGRTPARADLAVILLPAAPPEDADAEAKTAFQQWHGTGLAIVDGFAERARVTLAAAPSGATVEGSALEAVRGDSRRAARTASVDYVDTPGGQLAVVLAFAEALQGETGHYGTGAGVDGLIPATASD